MYHLRKETYERDLDYSRIDLPIPSISSKTGFYKMTNFGWMDQTLNILSTELALWKVKNEDKEI